MLTPKGNVPSHKGLDASHAGAGPFRLMFPHVHMGSVRLSLPSQGGEKLPFLEKGKGLSAHIDFRGNVPSVK